MIEPRILDPRSGPSLRDRLAFVLALWVSLATAIVCAVVPAGLPATRTVGSAFDPSTTVVVLRSKAPEATRLVATQPDDGGAGQGGDGAVVAALALQPAILSAAFLSGARDILPASVLRILLPRAVAITLLARPPPRA